jgi:hypothetical protein
MDEGKSTLAIDFRHLFDRSSRERARWSVTHAIWHKSAGANVKTGTRRGDEAHKSQQNTTDYVAGVCLCRPIAAGDVVRMDQEDELLGNVHHLTDLEARLTRNMQVHHHQK